MFATGSFDNVVRVFELKKNSCIELKHHKDRVRSIQWNSEMPWMLISAGDDQRVVVWDLRTQKVLTAITEPTLAMTSLISHPSKPFSMISSHFDSSILFWSLLSIPEVALAQYKFLLNAPVNTLLSTPEESY